MTGTQNSAKPAIHSGTFNIGGDLPVHRLGFGSMRLTGRGVWGPDGSVKLESARS